MNQKFFITGILFILILLSGLWVSRTGRPLNVFIFTIHKLISLAAGVYLVINIYRIHQVAPLNPLELAACSITIVFFLVMVATGGLLSSNKTIPVIVLKIHQIVPFVVILSTAVNLYLLIIRR